MKFRLVCKNNKKQIKLITNNKYYDSCNKYIAISYLWGGNEKWELKDIIPNDVNWVINGGNLKRVQNILNAFLEELEDFLWIDCCCINQNDEIEKSYAIPAMSLIYKNAQFVVVPLDILLNFPTDYVLVETNIKLDFINNNLNINDLLNCKHKINELIGYINILCIILEDQWWTRCWTLQESILSNKLIFFVWINNKLRKIADFHTMNKFYIVLENIIYVLESKFLLNKLNNNDILKELLVVLNRYLRVKSNLEVIIRGKNILNSMELIEYENSTEEIRTSRLFNVSNYLRMINRRCKYSSDLIYSVLGLLQVRNLPPTFGKDIKDAILWMENYLLKSSLLFTIQGVINTKNNSWIGDIGDLCKDINNKQCDFQCFGHGLSTFWLTLSIEISGYKYTYLPKRIGTLPLMPISEHFKIKPSLEKDIFIITEINNINEKQRLLNKSILNLLKKGFEQEYKISHEFKNIEGITDLKHPLNPDDIFRISHIIMDKFKKTNSLSLSDMTYCGIGIMIKILKKMKIIDNLIMKRCISYRYYFSSFLMQSDICISKMNSNMEYIEINIDEEQVIISKLIWNFSLCAICLSLSEWGDNVNVSEAFSLSPFRTLPLISNLLTIKKFDILSTANRNNIKNLYNNIWLLSEEKCNYRLSNIPVLTIAFSGRIMHKIINNKCIQIIKTFDETDNNGILYSIGHMIGYAFLTNTLYDNIDSFEFEKTLYWNYEKTKNIKNKVFLN